MYEVEVENGRRVVVGILVEVGVVVVVGLRTGIGFVEGRDVEGSLRHVVVVVLVVVVLTNLVR